MSENKVTASAETIAASKYTVEYVLEQIEKIAAETAYLHEAIRASTSPDGSMGETQAIGLGNMVESRESTNRKLIDFYHKIYEDLKPVSALQKMAMEIVPEAIRAGDTGPASFAGVSELLDAIRKLG